ncbi:MAG: crotonase/enoyl-CoA hydratase family protein [Pseudomonadales bacterium]
MSVTLQISDGVGLITLDDGKANAVSHALLDELEPALDEAEATADAVVLAGRPGKFCAGFDLAVMQGDDRAEMSRLLNRGGRLAHRLYGYPRPLVAAATGHALALGAILLLACDTRVGARGAFKLGLNETAIGMALPVFGTELAKARLDPALLTASVIQARLYDPEAAVAAGYLDVVTEPERVVEEATRIASQLAMLSGPAYAATKRTLRQDSLDVMAASLA